MQKLLCLAAALGALAATAHAQTTFTVALRPLADEKAVFATVESRNVVPARARAPPISSSSVTAIPGIRIIGFHFRPGVHNRLGTAP